MTEIVYRPPRPEELADCALVWHVATDDYMRKLNRPLPPPVLDRLVLLLQHLFATDPERFIVAAQPSHGRRRDTILGFGIAVQREHVWFLSQLYVLPDFQNAGIGHSMLRLILPSDGGEDRTGVHGGQEAAARPGVLATTTDSAQPASNGLYSGLGIVPRMPLFNLVGRPTAAMDRSLPRGVRAIGFPEVFSQANGDPKAKASARAIADAIDSIDGSTLGYAHRADHRHLLDSGRVGFVYQAGSGEVLGYGYTSASGRLGPVALVDETLTAAVLAHLLDAVEPRGATTVWVPGDNDRGLIALLRAGLVIEGFPALLCWTRPFARFDRYLPAGPALL